LLSEDGSNFEVKNIKCFVCLRIRLFFSFYRQLVLYLVIGVILISLTRAQTCIIPHIYDVDWNTKTFSWKNRRNYQICSQAFHEFVGIGAVETLDLSNNLLTVLPNDLFKPLTNIIEINLRENRLTIISFDEFSNNQQLRKLDLRFNNIKTIQHIQYSGRFSIKELLLFSNELTDISELCKLSNLKTLDLSSNQVNFKSFNFNCWSELMNLDLTDNELMARLFNNYQILSGLAKLEQLILQNNKLKVLCIDNFPDLPKLKFLSVADNELQSLDAQKLHRKFPKLTKIRLSKKYWSCGYLDSLETELNNSGITIETTDDDNCDETIISNSNTNFEVCEIQKDEEFSGMSSLKSITTKNNNSSNMYSNNNNNNNNGNNNSNHNCYGSCSTR
jgi:Leucine-rich repeat (LRR) protein